MKVIYWKLSDEELQTILRKIMKNIETIYQEQNGAKVKENYGKLKDELRQIHTEVKSTVKRGSDFYQTEFSPKLTALYAYDFVVSKREKNINNIKFALDDARTTLIYDSPSWWEKE